MGITLHWRRFRYRSLMRCKARNVLYVPRFAMVHDSTYALSELDGRVLRPPRPAARAACRAPKHSGGHPRVLGRAAGRPPGRPAARAACREPKLAAGFFAFRRRCKHSEYNSDVEDTETDQPRKAGHLNRLQCKVMTSNVIRTSVNEGVQPRERRSDSAERRSTSRKRSKRSGYSEELRTTLPRD